MKENINSYGDKVKTLKNFMEAVRKTPGQYIGYIETRGHINMIREVYQNSMDEQQRIDSPCNYVKVEYYEETKTIIVTDNGRGIPFNNIERILTVPNTSVNFEKADGDFTAGRHGVGSKVTNALSSEFFVNSYIAKEFSETGAPQGRRMEFREGVTWDKGEMPIPNENNLQGTIIEFRPSHIIMGEITTTCEDVLKLISLLLPLMKIGAVTDFYGVKANGTVIEQHMVNEDGIVTFLILNTSSPLIAPIVFNKKTGRMKADIAFTYDSEDLGVENILSFANTCPTVNTNDSTHVSGFLEAITNYFRNYMNRIYLNKSKITVVNNDIKCGLRAVVSVSHIEPMFSGQAKEIFSNRDIVPFIKILINEGLDEWCKTNSSDLQRLCKYFKDVADLRLKSDKEKVNLVKRYAASTLTGLPEKYERPNGKDHLELVIVEGDSAKSPAVTGRCNDRQGIFPIRGKVANAMTKSRKEFFNNEEVQGIMHIIDSGIGANFDIDKCKFEKIIIMCDADLDGLHIRTLLLKMFLMYYTPLIEAGRLYGAVPPLYGVNIKGKYTYFTSKLDFIKYIEGRFSSENEVLDFTTNKKIPLKELNGILYRNSNYVRDLNIISDTYAIDPLLLEYCISIRNLPFDKFKKAINASYRFLDVSQKNGIIILDGLVGEKIDTVIFAPNFVNACATLFHYIDSDASNFIVNGERTSLYGLMKKFESYKPPNVTRYKGLGEMNAKQLKESTLHPDSNRTLLRYTTSNIKKEIEEIREIECNKSLLLKGVDIAAFDL
jgi:DNA gyrase/topoisomerase IV subunit B